MQQCHPVASLPRQAPPPPLAGELENSPSNFSEFVSEFTAASQSLPELEWAQLFSSSRNDLKIPRAVALRSFPFLRHSTITYPFLSVKAWLRIK